MPHSASRVYGVDVGVRALSIADNHGTTATLRLSTTAVGATRLHLAHTQASIWFRQKLHQPELIVVEQPFGRFPKATLEQMVGVVLASLAGTHGCPVLTMPPPQWKAEVGLKGNAPKEDVMAWAKGRGYAGDVQDEADALGVAVAGALVLERELRRAA